MKGQHFKLGGRVFKSSGDPMKDYLNIREKYPDVEDSYVQTSLTKLYPTAQFGNPALSQKKEVLAQVPPQESSVSLMDRFKTAFGNAPGIKEYFEKKGVPVSVEGGDISVNGKPLDPNNAGVYLKEISRNMFPALRVGDILGTSTEGGKKDYEDRLSAIKDFPGDLAEAPAEALKVIPSMIGGTAGAISGLGAAVTVPLGAVAAGQLGEKTRETYGKKFGTYKGDGVFTPEMGEQALYDTLFSLIPAGAMGARAAGSKLAKSSSPTLKKLGEMIYRAGIGSKYANEVDDVVREKKAGVFGKEYTPGQSASDVARQRMEAGLYGTNTRIAGKAAEKSAIANKELGEIVKTEAPSKGVMQRPSIDDFASKMKGSPRAGDIERLYNQQYPDEWMELGKPNYKVSAKDLFGEMDSLANPEAGQQESVYRALEEIQKDLSKYADKDGMIPLDHVNAERMKLNASTQGSSFDKGTAPLQKSGPTLQAELAARKALKNQMMSKMSEMPPVNGKAADVRGQELLDDVRNFEDVIAQIRGENTDPKIDKLWRTLNKYGMATSRPVTTTAGTGIYNLGKAAENAGKYKFNYTPEKLQSMLAIKELLQSLNEDN